MDIQKNTDPIALFHAWFAEACTAEPNDPDAAALATVSQEGWPNVRMVLVKQVDENGFCFFTNKNSTKGQEINAQPRAALCYHWKSLTRQVRVQGDVVSLDDVVSDAYFASRHPVSRYGAIASQQSAPLDNRAVLENAVKDVAALYPDEHTIPRPDHWGGFRIIPTRIEFWQQGDNRLHDRFVFVRDAHGWDVERLYP